LHDSLFASALLPPASDDSENKSPPPEISGRPTDSIPRIIPADHFEDDSSFPSLFDQLTLSTRDFLSIFLSADPNSSSDSSEFPLIVPALPDQLSSIKEPAIDDRLFTSLHREVTIGPATRRVRRPGAKSRGESPAHEQCFFIAPTHGRVPVLQSAAGQLRLPEFTFWKRLRS
jgi:hypothetical protein